MIHGNSGVRPFERRRTINMISGGGGGARGQGPRGAEIQGGQEGGGEVDEIPDAVLEGLFSDHEDEDQVAGLFGDFEEEEAAGEAAAPEADDQQEVGEAAPPPNIILPLCPSQEDWDEHFRTHT